MNHGPLYGIEHFNTEQDTHYHEKEKEESCQGASFVC